MIEKIPCYKYGKVQPVSFSDGMSLYEEVGKIAYKQNEVIDAVNEAVETVEGYDERLEDVESAVDTLGDEIDSLQSSVSGLQTDVSSLSSTVSGHSVDLLMIQGWFDSAVEYHLKPCFTVEQSSTGYTVNKTFQFVRERIEEAGNVYGVLVAGETPPKPVYLYPERAVYTGTTSTPILSSIEFKVIEIDSDDSEIIYVNKYRFNSDNSFELLSATSANYVDEEEIYEAIENVDNVAIVSYGSGYASASNIIDNALDVGQFVVCYRDNGTQAIYSGRTGSAGSYVYTFTTPFDADGVAYKYVLSPSGTTWATTTISVTRQIVNVDYGEVYSDITTKINTAGSLGVPVMCVRYDDSNVKKEAIYIGKYSDRYHFSTGREENGTYEVWECNSTDEWTTTVVTDTPTVRVNPKLQNYDTIKAFLDKNLYVVTTPILFTGSTGYRTLEVTYYDANSIVFSNTPFYSGAASALTIHEVTVPKTGSYSAKLRLFAQSGSTDATIA